VDVVGSKVQVGTLVALAALAAGCGGAPAQPVEPKPELAPQHEAGPAGPTSTAEIGALDEEQTKAAFDRAGEGLTSCFTKGAERIPFLSGDVAFYVRVASDGSARYAYVEDSTLGDRETEQCMVSVLEQTTFPKPVGGEQGIAKRSMHFDPGGDERPPVSGSPNDLGKPLRKAKPALSKCIAEAGTGPMKATLYVDTDGKASGVGVAMSDEKGEKAASCVVDVLRGTTFPSPGSWASKVTIDLP
jgi:hypothetical protein